MLTLCLILSLAAAGPPKLPPLPGQGIPAPTTPQKAEPEPEPKPEPKPGPESEPKPAPAPARSPTSEKPYVADPFSSDDASHATAKPSGQQPSAKKTAPQSKPTPAASQPAQPSAQPERLRLASERELEALAWTPSPSELDASPRRGPEISVVTRNHDESPQRGGFLRAGSEPPERSAAFVLGYRQFWIRDALGRRQAWHVGSIEVSPLRRYVRLNLMTEVGVEGGEAAQRGDRADLMVVQKAGLGVQYPHWVTPFVEFQGGAGGARIEVFERNDLIFLYTLGVEAGAQWAVSKWMFIHAAAGWVRPVMRHRAGTIRHDSFTFKLGLGF